MPAAASRSRDKVRNYRSRMRAKGMKLVQFWVPDVHSAEFKAQARRDSMLIANSPYEADDQAFVDSISEFTDEQAKRLQRGEIWTVAGGANYAGKPRPVVIVQADDFLETESITICPITTHNIGTRHARAAIDPTPESGLREPSFAMTDKLTTVPRGKLGKRVGVLAPDAMVPINRAIIVFLGLAG